MPRARRLGRPSAPDGPLRPLRAAALGLLGRRDYTTAELRTRLLDRGYADAEVDALLTALQADRLLDDGRVAAAHVRAASRVKRRGRLRIERELAARGVDRATARQALAALSKDDDVEAIRQILARRPAPSDSGPAARRRLYQHLLRRGFAPDAIARVLGRRDEDD